MHFPWLPASGLPNIPVGESDELAMEVLGGEYKVEGWELSLEVWFNDFDIDL